MIEVSNGFNQSIYLCFLIFSLPAKRFLSGVYKLKTHRYINPWRIEIYIDFTIFLNILIWVISMHYAKHSVPNEIFYEYDFPNEKDVLQVYNIVHDI